MAEHQQQQPYYTLSSRRTGRPAADGSSLSSGDSAYGSSAGDERTPSATHDISRVNYHVKHLSDFAKSLEDSAARAFPNRGRSQRYKKVQALLLHWMSDDLFVLPELEDLERCLREDYGFSTDTFAIPSDNSHLELMMRVGAMIKEHESTDTLFLLYYGGHARIDESRQSTWCATRSSESPWLQWSAIQTLLERSLSDCLILLDCCAGAASATFPNGSSITETISASSWDAVAPDPGRYSFTNALIEVLQEWKHRTYSAAMLHAEVLARLKHPRPVLLNGKHFEARSTPVHFMMTSNHRAPSIEMVRTLPDGVCPPSPPQEPDEEEEEAPTPTGRSAGPPENVPQEPNEDVPHVMISLALEDDQQLDVNAWENWLAAFPAMAKYVKVQGVFKSHSTLVLLSLPVMVWDLLPENPACNFIAFIRSNNLAVPKEGEVLPEQLGASADLEGEEDVASIYSGTTVMTGAPRYSIAGVQRFPSQATRRSYLENEDSRSARSSHPAPRMYSGPPEGQQGGRWGNPMLVSPGLQRPAPPTPLARTDSQDDISMPPILNKSRRARTTVLLGDSLPYQPALAPHVQRRLEEYFQGDDKPTVAVTEFLASNLGIETKDIDIWFHHRREQQQVAARLQSLHADHHRQDRTGDVAHMILPGHLNQLLAMTTPGQVLIVDLRPPSDYQKSHIHGSVNLRAPANYVQRASLEMVEKTIADETGRKTFSKWSECRCVVFYDRHVEFAWECPTAEALLNKFKAQGWAGHGFILKGHYREFSDSFDKYTRGTKMSADAKNYLESMNDTWLAKQSDNQQSYEDWLKLVEGEDRVVSADLTPTSKAERMEAMVQQQKSLEDELERRLPSLYRKAMDLPVDENWERKAPMVAHLSRGLAKMEEAGRSRGEAAYSVADYPEKRCDPVPPSGSGTGAGASAAEDYDLMESEDEAFGTPPQTKGRAKTPAEQPPTGKAPKQKGIFSFNKILGRGTR